LDLLQGVSDVCRDDESEYMYELRSCEMATLRSRMLRVGLVSKRDGQTDMEGVRRPMKLVFMLAYEGAPLYGVSLEEVRNAKVTQRLQALL